MGMFSRSSSTPQKPTFLLLPQGANAPSAARDKPRQSAQDAPKARYQFNQQCIYERRLPGAAYMTAHISRLQPGIYDNANVSKATVQVPRSDKLANKMKPVAGVSDKAQCYYDYNRDLLQAQSLHKSLRKKANRNSIHAEYLLDGRRRPYSYHSLIHKLEDLDWPPSSSTSSIASAPSKPREKVYFLALSFVLHPSNSLSHRFKSAKIRLSIDLADDSETSLLPPKIIKYAPHLISGSVSHETLNWTFNLAGSLGVTQGPANASIQPSEGYSASTTLSKMMRIQGSTRTTDTGVEDGEVLWTMEENPLQQSGLPREFTFVLLVQDPNGDPDNIDFAIDVEPVIHTWYGRYPEFWQRRRCYQPLYKAPLDFRERIGQRFFSTVEGKADPGAVEGNGTQGGVVPGGKGTQTAGTASKDYNFANMDCDLDDLVQLPGETYSQAR